MCPRPACKNILPGIEECHVTARLVVRGRISHKLTFDLVGKCSCESFESAVRICSYEAAVQAAAVSSVALSTREVTAPEHDFLVTHLAIRCAGDYNLIGRPVVHDGLARFLVSRHDCVQRVPHVLSHNAQPERRAVGVTRLGPNGGFLYFDAVGVTRLGPDGCFLYFAVGVTRLGHDGGFLYFELIINFPISR